MATTTSAAGRRQITFHLGDAFDAAVGGYAHDARVAAVVGYLALWAAHSPRYQNVAIHTHDNGDLTARYADAAGAVTYEIFAQRGPDGTYTTHS